MAYTVNQIEKHTIVLRLAVSIYRMDDDKLLEFLKLIENHPDTPDEESQDALSKLLEEKNSTIRRQMIIARLFVLIKQMDKDFLFERLIQSKEPNFRWVREYPRLDCYLLVDFAAKGRAYRSCIRDISANGVFIETSDVFEPDQAVALCFTLSEPKESLSFKVKGRVAQIYPDGIGVQYENITHYQREIIDTLINRIF